MSANVCRCLSCFACNGSGTIMVRTNSYPEEDLEHCEECNGSGVVEICQRCIDLEEAERDLP